MMWQPIETAPKSKSLWNDDGTENQNPENGVLTLTADLNIYAGYH